MRFRQYLLLEDLFADRGSHWFYGSVLLPSDAYDGAEAFVEPAEVAFLGTRWKLEKEAGRKFYNLDAEKYRRHTFTSVYSTTMPDTSPGFWKHDPSDRPALRIDRDAKLEIQGHRRRCDVANVLGNANPQIDKTKELDRLFGKFSPRPHQLPGNFDEPWTHRQ